LDDIFGQPNGNQHSNTYEFAVADSGLAMTVVPFGDYPDPDDDQNRHRLREQKRAALLRAYIEQLKDEAAILSSAGRSGIVPVKKVGEKVFIGHGHSGLWRELKDFLQDRLRLQCDEFNSEATAGYSTKERLKAMLDAAGFAFLVLTAEDEHPDGTLHPRENVIHEAGLFQGRLGFERAIILREQGCTAFSNIHGLTNIPFPQGNIAAIFEEIRRVLERERFI
jgi:predicted nucleotide-binding protein